MYTIKKRVLVIGAGPAGISAAKECAEKNFDVTIFEKGKIGENIKCAEGFFDEAKLLGKPEAGVRFKVEKLIVRVKSTYYIDTSDWNLWMIDRSIWQKDLAQRAMRKGVKIKENTEVLPEDLEELKKKFDFIIDASGAYSITSKAYGFSQFYKNHSGKTVQHILKGDFSYIKNSIKVGLMPDFWGYYWIFPKGSDIANVGVGNFCSEVDFNLPEILEDVKKREGLDKESYEIIGRLGGICPTKMLDRLVYDNILLVGDAAGLTSPFHGGGIDMAILSGKDAAKSICEGIFSYKDNLNKTLAERLEFDSFLANIWKNRDFDEMDEIVRKVCKYKLYRPFGNPKLLKPTFMKFVSKILNLKNKILRENAGFRIT